MLFALCAHRQSAPVKYPFLFSIFLLCSHRSLLSADILFVRAGSVENGIAVETALEIIHQTTPCSVLTLTFSTQIEVCATRTNTKWHRPLASSVSSEKCDCLTTQILHYYTMWRWRPPASSTDCLAVILSWHVYIIFYLTRIFTTFFYFFFFHPRTSNGASDFIIIKMKMMK